MIVVDASLATKWMLWEDETERALAFLYAYRREICGPDTLFVEVAGVIVRHANESKSRLPDIADDALWALDKWTVAWSMHVVKPHRVTQRRLARAGRLALELGHPLKDCIYLTLALELGCDLATCDARFRAKVAGRYSRIRLLSEFDLAPLPAPRER